MLRDPALAEKVRGEIRIHGVDAVTALNRALEEYNSLFARISDEYLRERMADVRDVAGTPLYTWFPGRDRGASLRGRGPLQQACRRGGDAAAGDPDGGPLRHGVGRDR